MSDLTNKEYVWDLLNTQTDRVIRYNKFADLLRFMEHYKLHTNFMTHKMAIGDNLIIDSPFGKIIYTETERARVINFLRTTENDTE